jgi:putative flippase GtrA
MAMKRFKELLAKQKSILAYLFFGVCTTLINVAAYFVCYHILKFANVPSTVIAWALSVLFAYVTNKLFVFESKSFDVAVLKKEIISFFGCRFLTGLMDLAIMYAAVDLLHRNATIWKLASNVVVIILNYVASKLIIFKTE